MNDLHPLARIVDVQLSSAALDNNWQHVQKRRRTIRQRRTGRRVGLMAAALLLCIGAAWYLTTTTQAPITLRDGGALPLALTRNAQTTIALSDGSQFVFLEQSTMDVLVNDTKRVELALRRGKMRFQVQPGTARHWQVYCGLLTVYVVGTRFDVEKSEAFVEVSVDKGTVLVKGAGVPDGVQKISAGEMLRVSAGHRSIAPVEVPASREPVIDTNSVPARDTDAIPRQTQRRQDLPGVASAAKQTWQTKAAHGRYAEAYAHLPDDTFSTLPTAAPSIVDLFLLSDVARMAGYPRHARKPLLEIVRRFPGTPEAGMAAYTLGNLSLDAFKNPADAMAYYQQAVALNVVPPLRETALYRIASYYAALDPVRAREACQKYIEQFPKGKYVSDIRRILHNL